MPKANEKSLEIVFAGLLDLAALETHIVDGDLASGDEAIEIDAERAYVFREIGGRLLECDRAPGSPNCCTPRTRNSIPNSVLPEPAPPVTSVVRPFGRPPKVISSNPAIPVGDFASARDPLRDRRDTLFANDVPRYPFPVPYLTESATGDRKATKSDAEPLQQNWRSAA